MIPGQESTFYMDAEYTFTDAKYFRSLAARCRLAARNCFDLRTISEFNLLADEFAHNADELEHGAAKQEYRSVAK
jgi:hypothetical protein